MWSCDSSMNSIDAVVDGAASAVVTENSEFDRRTIGNGNDGWNVFLQPFTCPAENASTNMISREEAARGLWFPSLVPSLDGCP